jgi:hypothetical protein
MPLAEAELALQNSFAIAVNPRHLVIGVHSEFPIIYPQLLVSLVTPNVKLLRRCNDLQCMGWQKGEATSDFLTSLKLRSF